MHRGCLLGLFLSMGFLSPAALHLHANTLTLSLEDSIERGIENSLNLQKSLIDLSIAEYSANRLWAEVFPTISGSLGASYESRFFSGDGFEMNKDGARNSASLGVTLSLNAGIPYTIKNIQLLYQTRLLQYEDARNQLEIQLTKNFFSLIADRDNLAVFADILNLAQRQYERNHVAFNNGLIGELTLVQSRLALENARYNLNVANSAFTGRMRDFLVQLGLPHDTDAALDGKIETAKVEFDVDQLIREYLPRRPDIANMRYEIERLENAERQTVYSTKAPSLSLSAQWSSSNFSPFTDSLRGSASLSIPIDPWIPGTSKNQAVRNASLAIEKARLDLQNVEIVAAAQIRSLAANLKDSWDSIAIARLSMAIAERNYQLAEQGFRSGTVESLRLEDAQNEFANTRQRLLRTELTYFNMILDISAALNIKWKELMQ